MKVNTKSEKGAITLIVLVTMLFLISFLMTLYIRISNGAQSSSETTKQIAQKYNNIGELEEIYRNYISSKDVIPLYTKEQLSEIGSNKQIDINGKVYTFTPDAYYTLMNDLDFGGYNKETEEWIPENKWTPITNKFTGVLDGLWHTIKGLYLGDDEASEGLFHHLEGTVRNLYIEGYIKNNNFGLVTGQNDGNIEDCYCNGKSATGEEVKLPETLKVGDYVNYTPVTGTYEISDDKTGVEGYQQEYEEDFKPTGKQTHTTETGEDALKWRVWSINEENGVVELVSENGVECGLRIYGINLYNYGVDILNDFCKTLYSNGKAVARSMNIDDINSKTTIDLQELPEDYGKCYILTDETNTGNPVYCPALYRRELGSTEKGLKDTNPSLIKPSEGVRNPDGTADYTTYTGQIASSTLYATRTGFSHSIHLDESLGRNTATIDLIGESSSWLASRCVWIDSESYAPQIVANFCVYCTYYGEGSYAVECRYILDSTGEPPYGLSELGWIRPIVTLPANTVFTEASDKINDTQTWDIEY